MDTKTGDSHPKKDGRISHSSKCPITMYVYVAVTKPLSSRRTLVCREQRRMLGDVVIERQSPHREEVPVDGWLGQQHFGL